MKRISFFLTLTLLILSFGLANAAQEVTIDHIDGSYEDGGDTYVQEGLPITFHLRVTNTDFQYCKYAPSMAFTVTSSDGATWGSITMAQNILWIDVIVEDIVEDTFWFETLFAQKFLLAGDTVGFSGVSFYDDTALYYGFDDVAFTVTTGPIAADGDGSSLCIDWGGSRNDGFDWGWGALDTDSLDAGVCDDQDPMKPFIGGCFEIGTPPDFPPVFTDCPTTIEGSHCAPLSHNFGATDPDPGAGDGPDDITYSADIGSIDGSGNWSHTGDLAGVGTAITLTVIATEEDNPTTSSCVVNIVLTNDAPEFTDGCNVDIFGQNGVLKEHPMAGKDTCSGDPMTMYVDDPGGITGTVEFNGTTLEITGVSGVDTGPHTILVGITDGVDSGAICEVRISLSDGALYVLEIEKTHGTIQGTFANVAINLTSAPPDMGGFNLLIAYDASALTFQGATAGEMLDRCDWEYFTYRYGADGNCNGGCPSGLVRLVGIAETNNGPNHPVDACDAEGVLANLSFLVSNDRTLECQYVPIRFFWIECGDNTITNAAGTILYLATTVKEWPGDGANLMETYEAVFPSFIGPEDGCFDGDKEDVLSDIDFVNGGIDIICADSIDARGDLNLDGLAYTIADAVMYSNYFVDGLSALVFVTEVNQYGYVPGYAGSIAASDVNADGLALTVADLVYLIRVVVGDAQPYPKVTPMAANLIVGNTLSVDVEMGAAFVVLAGDQTPTLLADGMDMKITFDGENTRVLVWNVDGNTFEGDFLGNVGNVISAELASADGSPVMATKLPANFALGQNYPNPFNPSTSFAISLPEASDYTVTIYNVTGQVVETINGSSEAGFVPVTWDASNRSSGVYFYKLTAGNFTDTKKMVLLK